MANAAPGGPTIRCGPARVAADGTARRRRPPLRATPREPEARPSPSRRAPHRHRGSGHDRQRPAREPRVLRVPHAGWRVIAAKELGDHLLSLRFIVLLVVLGLAAAIPLYFAADIIRGAAPRGQRLAGRLPALCSRSGRRTTRSCASTRSWRSSRRCSAWPSPSTPSTASAPTGRCHASWRSRSTATTSSTASSRRACRSSGSCCWPSSGSSPGTASSGSGSRRRARRSSASAAWILVTFIYVGLWLAFGLLLSVLVRRAATSALIGFGVWFLLTIFGGLIVTLLARAVSPVTGTTIDEQIGQAQTQQFITRLLPSELYSEVTKVLLNPSEQPAGGPARLPRPGAAGSAADPDPARLQPEPAAGHAPGRRPRRADRRLLRARLRRVHEAGGSRLVSPRGRRRR